MSTTRESLIRLYREYREAHADYTVCKDCDGTGLDTYGECQTCDGKGTWLTEWDADACREAHVQRRTEMNRIAIDDARVDRAVALQPNAWRF